MGSDLAVQLGSRQMAGCWASLKTAWDGDCEPTAVGFRLAMQIGGRHMAGCWAA